VGGRQDGGDDEDGESRLDGDGHEVSSVPVRAHEGVEEVSEDEQADGACDQVFPHGVHDTSGGRDDEAR
jgi:hypothetical protein